MANTDDMLSWSERDVCSKRITPALIASGWDQDIQIREEVGLTPGRINVRGRVAARQKGRRADYVLYHRPGIPLAVIEAKDANHSVGDGMQQALGYADMLEVPFVFSSNGKGFLFHDSTVRQGKVETQLDLKSFPKPADLWQRFRKWKGLDDKQDKIFSQDYYIDAERKELRYYQMKAINRTVEAVAKGQRRGLLVMATGTGKTHTAFQIAWRLWKSGEAKRILFLADRDILVSQTKNNDFKPFGKAMVRMEGHKVDKAFEVYLSLYQAITGEQESQKAFKEFSREFFDLIIIDECHRGSAADDASWKEILEYFSSAVQIGMTATPRETKYVSNINYFGESIFTYSLKEGIEDGFLAPYKVVRIDLDRDFGWRPERGKLDKQGLVIEDRIYDRKDMNTNLVLEARDLAVAKKLTDFLRATDPYAKTIVFCDDVDQAERMRQALVNLNADLVAIDRRYVMRMTGDELEGKRELDNFIDPESRYPVIATTSKLLSTGVDVRTCKVIVLDKNIQSMTEFKQILGRGTRVMEEYGKLYFTVLDFKQATRLFADPDFDGEPVKIYEPGATESPVPPEDDVLPLPEEESHLKPKYVVGEEVDVRVAVEREQYYGPDGKLITESLKDYTKKTLGERFNNLEEFLKVWRSAERKQAMVEELREQGLILEGLQQEVGKDYDPFDLICHVVFDCPPLTRRERANNVRKRNYFAKYGQKAQNVLNALLEKYSDEGLENLESLDVLNVKPISEIGTPVELVGEFGGKAAYLAAIKDMEDALYSAA